MPHYQRGGAGTGRQEILYVAMVAGEGFVEEATVDCGASDLEAAG